MANNTLNNDHQQYQERLAKWENFLGLPKFEPERSEIETILIMTREELRQCSSLELAEYGFMLAQYAMFLQQKANECQAFLKWADHEMGRLLAEDKTKLVVWTRNVTTRNIRISYLARRIEIIVQALANLGRARYNNERKTDESTVVN